jgi:GDP-4-dehydro-6-deoxy-D-mannose reductase
VRCFVTGIGGFAGAHLADHLLAAGHQVGGSITGRADRPSLQALRARHDGALTLAEADVTDRATIERVLAAFEPEAVFHLAGLAYVPRAGADAARTIAVNTLGTINVLDAARQAAPRSTVLVVGSAEAYGAIDEHALPVSEDTPLRPLSIYGISKASADMAAYQRWWSSDLAVIRVRPFNHTGPGQSPDFVCSDFARQIAQIEAGAAPPVLRVGNLGVVRDFSDVRDVVRGYALLATHGAPGAVYNLCSGTGTSIGRIIELLTAASTMRVEVVEERARVRHREVAKVVGSAARAAALGWRTEIALADTLRELLDDWRRRVAAERH